MMRLLLIDTCGSEGSVVLAQGEAPEIVASEMLPGRGASERLVPVIRREMEANGWKPHDLTAIAVVHGPGSFTGVRVGLSAAKGLCEAARVPLIAVSRLAVVANAAGKVDGEVCAVLDAGRGEFYCGVYSGREKISEALLTAEEVARVAESVSAVIACEPKTADALSALGPLLVKEPKARDALPFAVERIAREEFDDTATTDANYLRRTDLEIFAKMARGSAP
jgi:tRNA threonylcarbamoyladenosine biosynthesis protein TsaB